MPGGAGYFRKVGGWEKVKSMVGSLTSKMHGARQKSLMRWGLKAEALAKGHISGQDLGWRPLNPQYLAWKVKKGYSENTYVMTSSYFQSITSFVKSNTAFAGVKRGAKNLDGGDLVTIAKALEYGTRKIPARPLWQPVFEETMDWHYKNNNPADIFMADMKKSYGSSANK